MNKKAIQWLYQELPVLVSKGVLPEQSAEALRAYYGDVRSSDKKAAVIILCSVLGALLIGLGIISLFAHNWEELSRPVRTVLSLLPLIAVQTVGLWVMINRPASQALKEGVATFWSLMIAAAIALISQTYNIPGDTSTFVLVWMLLSAPLVYLLSSTIAAAIYVAGITAWTSYFWSEPLTAFFFWPLLAVVIPHFIWSLRQETYGVRAGILAFVMAGGIYFGAALTLGRSWPMSWIVIGPAVAALFYLLGSSEFKGISTHWQRPLRVLGGLGLFVLMLILTSRYPWEAISTNYEHGLETIASWTAVPDHVMTVLLVGGVTLFAAQFAKRQDWMRTLFGIVPLLALFCYSMGTFSPTFSMWLFNAFLLGLSVFRLITGIRMGSLGLINTGLLMLSALVLVRFFDSGFSFILKGIVFILIGIGFLVANVMILRRKGGAL